MSRQKLWKFKINLHFGSYHKVYVKVYDFEK